MKNIKILLIGLMMLNLSACFEAYNKLARDINSFGKKDVVVQNEEQEKIEDTKEESVFVVTDEALKIDKQRADWLEYIKTREYPSFCDTLENYIKYKISQLNDVDDANVKIVLAEEVFFKNCYRRSSF